jgi:uncharacterized metal-binding protein YceD (DUF177 family)
MTIDFHKISYKTKDIYHTVNGVKLKATLTKKSKDTIELHGKLTGNSTRACDRCGGDMTIVFDEDLQLFLFDGIYVEKENDINTIDIENNKIDFDKLIKDEIISTQSDFAVCDMCLENKTKG